MPLAEQQAHWVADLIAGDVTLPPVSEMRAQIAAYDAALRKRYVASKRHTIQVDAHTYRAEIERERRTRRRDA
jgi:dimethylaniline monooxygenase (N-oxide forming)